MVLSGKWKCFRLEAKIHIESKEMQLRSDIKPMTIYKDNGANHLPVSMVIAENFQGNMLVFPWKWVRFVYNSCSMVKCLGTLFWS